MEKRRLLIIGAAGQIGVELTAALRAQFGTQNVVASDIRETPPTSLTDGPYEVLDLLDQAQLRSIIDQHAITDVYVLAAMLSATAEKHPKKAWDLNMLGLLSVLELAKDKVIKKVFWPSSIAVFGPTTPRQNTPQHTITEPTTVYGISKLAGERWCEYYHTNYNVDVRSVRYPGLISYKSRPGGGTTDYAVDIFYKALEQGSYDCFLRSDSRLPMMHMDDAIKGTLQLMQADASDLSIWSSYNVAGIDFTPAEIAAEIQKYLPAFTIKYAPDFRQKIADSWPESINDELSCNDWGLDSVYDLPSLVQNMLHNLRKKLEIA